MPFPVENLNMSPLVAPSLHAHDDFSDSPIHPDWVLTGSPRARGKLLASTIGGTQVALWECTAGSFRWQYGPYDETVHILEGSVRILDAPGGERVLQAGDAALFVAGSTAHWVIDDYVKKLAVLHDRRTLPRRAAAHFWNKARGGGSGGLAA